MKLDHEWFVGDTAFSSVFNTMTELRTLSKALNPQLLPGVAVKMATHRSVRVCVCVFVCVLTSITWLDHTSFPFLIIISMRASRLCCHSRWCYSLLYASYEGNMSQSILLIILDDTWRSKATGQGERKGRKVHKGLTSTCEVRRCTERKEYKEKASFLQNTCFYLFSVTEGSKKQGETWYFMAVQTPLEPPTFLLSLPVFLN